jgi:hypothetical protein
LQGTIQGTIERTILARLGGDKACLVPPKVRHLSNLK